MIYIIGAIGVVILGLLAGLDHYKGQADVAKARVEACTGANKALELDANTKIDALTKALRANATIDQGKAAAMRAELARLRAKQAADAGALAALTAIASGPPAPLPEAQECAQARQILRDYAVGATKP